MTDSTDALKSFVLRAMTFEADAVKLKSKGVKVGPEVDKEAELMSATVARFGVHRRIPALQMGSIYIGLHCMESELRAIVREVLRKREGADWAKQLPSDIRKAAEARQAAAYLDSALEGEPVDVLGYVSFRGLAKVVVEKWPLFQGLIRSQQWLVQRMDELEGAKNFIANNGRLKAEEYQRLYAIMSEWHRVLPRTKE